MTVASPLLEILVCPKCQEHVVPAQNENLLICHRCQLHYPVRDGIPVMMLDEAQAVQTSE